MVLHCEEDGLVFRTSEHVPDVIKQVLSERGWIEFDEENDTKSEGSWNLWWKTQRFRKSEHDEVASWQRLNHFPKTDAITRKDCLVRNLRCMKCIHGATAFNFHPTAYILPNEYTKFVADFAQESQKNTKKNIYWICKPVDLSRGRGIFIFRDLKDLTYDCSVVVQRYVINPFLISGYKFDIRLYVCVPSFHPLTIYMYQEGIVRFSTEKYDLNQLTNVYSHLTNTSINKYGPAYSSAKERVGSGCKWTLSQFRSYLRQLEGVDEMLLWYRISNIITCTLATQAPTVPKCRNSFEVFGFDVLIDDQMKPWLLEVNFSPALSMDCQADFIAKRSMLNDLIDLLNFKERDREHGGPTYRSCSNSTFNLSQRNSSREPDAYYARKSTNRSPDSGLSAAKLVTEQPERKNVLTNERSFQKNKLTENRKSLKAAKGAPNSQSDTTYRKSSQTLSLPSLSNIRRRSSGSVDVQTSPSASVSSFPRNPSTSSIASSVSSVDNSNQPENSHDDSDDISLAEGQNNSHSDESVESLQGCNTEGTPDEDMDGREARQHSVPNCSHLVQISSPKSYRKKKNINSAPNPGRISLPEKLPNSKPNSGKTRLKNAASYKSPYSKASTTIHKSSMANPWPRTRVGDFILTFPLNEAMKKASGANLDMKTIIKEHQKILKKLSGNYKEVADTSLKSSTSISRSEALQLSFQMKFDEKDKNPLYFWGPQNPPLLANVLQNS